MSARTSPVREVAARLPGALASRDGTEAARLLAAVATHREMTALVLLLASVADRRKLNAATGLVAATPAELHARFVWLRERGVPRDQIGARITEGERAYQAQSKRARRKARAA